MMFHDDLDFLVSETLRDCEERTFQREVPQVPGLVYTIQKSGATFVIRAIECSNMADLYSKIKTCPSDFPSLRLDLDVDTEQQCRFFECDSIEQARIVKLQLANQRFPIEEEQVFNVGDPSLSWWLKVEEGKLQVYFKLSQTIDLSQMEKLGPLGDGQIFYQLLLSCLKQLGTMMPVRELSYSTQVLTLVSDEHNPYFQSLVHLLETGELNDLWRRFFPEWRDLAAIRRLWRCHAPFV